MKIKFLTTPYLIKNKTYKGIFRIMKICFIFLFVFSFQLMALNTEAQEAVIELETNSMTVGQLIEEIEKQTDYLVVYSNREVDANRKVDVQRKSDKVSSYLDEAFAGTDIGYDFENNYIVLMKKTRRNASTVAEMIRSAQQQGKTITGKVVDVNGEPIIGANIIEVGTTSGTVTDIDGNFSLKVADNATIRVSYIGYVEQEINTAEKTSFNITLVEDTQALEEVVVVGYGVQKKVNLTGAVATVDSKMLETRPVSSVGHALQGVAPGLNLDVNNGGGALGNALNINIRGKGTIGTGSNDSPLILIDGMEGNMNTLNLEDIESISVLKDAASAAIYGSRAAFGVVLITTKSGQAGKMRVSYNNNFRYSGPTNLPRPLDSYRFAMFFNEANVNQGGNPIFTEEVLERIIAFQRGEITETTVPNASGTNWEFHERANDNVNWYEKHFKWNWTQEHNVSLNGGTEQLKYYASAGYMDQGGNLRFGDDKYQRFTFTGKVNSELSKYIDLNVSAKFIRFELDNPFYMENAGLLFHDIARIWPMMPFKDPNGYYMRNGKINQLVDGGRSVRKNDDLYGQFQVIIKPLKGWNIVGESGIRVINQNDKRNLGRVFEHNVQGEPLPLPFDGDHPAGATFAYSGYSNVNFYTNNLYSDYTIEKGPHYAKAMVGASCEQYHIKALSAQRTDVVSDLVPEIGAAVGEDKITGSNNSEWATAGYFSRLNYVYADRYLLEVNFRYDGSSRFLRDQRWNLFSSFSAGWNVAQEPFFEPFQHYISTLKPRVSWGQLGNQNTDSFYPFYLLQPISANAGGWLMDGSRPTVASAPGMISETLTWERIYNTNYGFDVTMFNNRFNLSYDYFVRTTDKMVGPPREVGAVIGIGLPNTNNAKLENKGWELYLTWRDKIGNVGYNVGFNLSDNKAKVLKYPNPSKSLNTYYEGQILGDIWGYTTHGIAKTDAEMQEWLKTNDQSRLGSNWGAGDIMYKNLDDKLTIDNGSNTLDDHGDLSIIGNSNPRFRFGLNLGADWKGFDLSLFFQGVMKRDIWLNGPYFWGADGGLWQSVGFEEHLDYFRPADTDSYFGPNENGYFPKPYLGGRGDKNHNVQTRYLQDGSYIRLKNITIGYQIPTDRVNWLKVSNARVFVSGENVFTLSRIAKMFDPEATGGAYSSGKMYPLSATYSFGLNITL